MRLRLGAAMVLTIVCGCAEPFDGEEEHPGVATGGPSALGGDGDGSPLALAATTSFLRLDLTRDANGRIARREVAPVTLRMRPMPALAPEYLAVAYAGERVVSAVPVRFSPRATALGADAPGGQDAVGTGVATVFLETHPDVDRVVLAMQDGSEVALLGADELTAMSLPSWRSSGLGVTQRELGVRDLAAVFPHIRFLEPGEEGALPPGLLASAARNQSAPKPPAPGRIVTASAEITALVQHALESLPPLLFMSVQTIAVVSWPPEAAEREGLAAVALQHALVINANAFDEPAPPDARQRFIAHVMAHEATHCLTYLSDALPDQPQLAGWSGDAAATARELMERFEMARGLSRTWEQLHQSGVQLGLTAPYPADQSEDAIHAPRAAWRSTPDAQAWSKGFLSAYGSAAAYEDIANGVSLIQYPAKAPNICTLFAGKPRLELPLAIPYAKLSLLHSLGLITRATFDACVSRIGVDMRTGYAFEEIATFGTGLRHASWKSGNSSVLSLSAGNAGPYRFGLELVRADEKSTHLGLYAIQYVDAFSNVSNTTAAYLASDDVFQARASREGVALVTESTTTRLRGFIFNLKLQNALGFVTDVWPYGTFSAP